MIVENNIISMKNINIPHQLNYNFVKCVGNANYYFKENSFPTLHRLDGPAVENEANKNYFYINGEYIGSYPDDIDYFINKANEYIKLCIFA